MGEYIDKKQALKILNGLSREFKKISEETPKKFKDFRQMNVYMSHGVVASINHIESMPAVNTKIKQGKWELHSDADGEHGICSVCGKDADFSHYGVPFDFCPNCGARMDMDKENGNE